jgi:hypothetical protein
MQVSAMLSLIPAVARRSAALLVVGALVASPVLMPSTAHAYERGWHGGGWHGGGWGLGLGLGLGVDAALGWPGYYYPYGAYPYYPYYAPVAPAVTVLEAPPTVVATAPPAQQYWYYCANPAGYYPYVATCPTPWQAVSPTPPGVAPR